MAAKMGVLGLIMSFYQYLRSAMVWFPLVKTKTKQIFFFLLIFFKVTHGMSCDMLYVTHTNSFNPIIVVVNLL